MSVGPVIGLCRCPVVLASAGSAVVSASVAGAGAGAGCDERIAHECVEMFVEAANG